MRHFKRFINTHIVYVLAILAYTFYMGIYLFFDISLISGTSMYPNYTTGDFLLNYQNTIQIEAGDFVNIKGSHITQKLGGYSVYPDMAKRVIGLPGDTIVIYRNDVYINGEIQDEEYIYEPMNEDTHYISRLNSNEYFVMGDNRNVSLDSRHYGPVEHYAISNKTALRLDNFDDRSEYEKEEEFHRENGGQVNE